MHSVLLRICSLLPALHGVYYQVASDAELRGLGEVEKLYDEVWWHVVSGDLGVVSYFGVLP